jgi:cytidine deaminase
MNKKLPAAEAKTLLAHARDAMANAICPRSGFAVGAAVRCADGTIVTGSNVESPTVLQSACAERVALLKALSDGQRAFTHIAIIAAKRPAVPPCGLCRQMLMEFAPELIVITADAAGEPRQRPLIELLPDPFL